MRTTHLLVAFSSLAVPALAQQAYLIDSNLDQLFSVNLATGAATLIGSTLGTGLDTPAGLTWRADTQTLWTVDLSGGEVGTLNLLTGAFTSVYVANPTSGWQGIDWDPVGRRFFLLHQSSGLYSLDAGTGATTQVGTMTPTLTGAIDSDPSGILWASSFSPMSLYKVNKATGVPTLVVPSTISSVQGMSFAPDGTLYATNSVSLYKVDTGSGVATLIGAHGSGVNFAKGFEIVSTCTGGTSAIGAGCAEFSGTTMTMSFAGNPCIGQTVRLGASVGAQTSVFIVTLGASATQWGALPLPFSLAPLGNPGCTIYASQDVTIGAQVPNMTIQLPIPNNAGLLGAVAHFQTTVLDTRLPGLGVALSNLLSVVIGK